MAEHKNYLKKALFYEYLTIAWNIFEGVVCVTLGILSGSVALFAYGLESSVEVFASSVVVWDLKGGKKTSEEKALKLIGVAYLIVSAYVFIDAAQSLLSRHHPQQSLIGIIFLFVTAIVMTVLGLLKHQVGGKMKSLSVLADAKFTLIDAALSTTVLIGLLCNLLFGWWWIDQALALFIAGVAFREGMKEIL
jgi:divalent metal cation (Fe/Co/Zn/Cd) transporter